MVTPSPATPALDPTSLDPASLQSGTVDPAAAGSRPRLRRGAAYQRAADEKVNKLTSIPFFGVHVAAVAGVFIFGVTLEALVILAVTFVVRLWFITGAYHRYFSHRSYKTSRAFQLVLAVGGTSAAQKGPLWWAAHHRNHHRDSDTEVDIHSPLRGFWWSHVGWILCDKYAPTEYDRIKDFAKYPELRFLDKYDWIAPWTLAVICFLVGGWPGLFTGFLLSTVLLWHNTFMINSIAHVVGRRRYVTEDTSRNNLALAVSTLGEGWHNNHHYFQASARNGFFWWEIDVTYYVLKVLSWLHIVRDLKVPSAQMLAANRIKDGAFDIGMFKANWARAAAQISDSRDFLDAHDSLGDRVRERRAAAGDALQSGAEVVGAAVHHGVENLEHAVAARKEALESFVHDSLESAEELARLTRQRPRDLGFAES